MAEPSSEASMMLELALVRVQDGLAHLPVDVRKNVWAKEVKVSYRAKKHEWTMSIHDSDTVEMIAREARELVELVRAELAAEDVS